MTESQYTRYLGQHVKPHAYWLKIMTAFNNGVPDVWVSGNRDDLWIELKYVSKLPKRSTTILKPKLTELQLKWLKDRHQEHRNLCVILGSPIGAYIFTDRLWETGVAQTELTLKPKEIAQWIIKKVNHP